MDAATTRAQVAGEDAALYVDGSWAGRESLMPELVEEAPCGVFVADVAHRYAYVNRALCRMLGQSREQLLGKPVAQLIPPEEVERLQRGNEPAYACVAMRDCTLAREDGPSIQVEVSAKLGTDGRLRGFLRDVTDRRRQDARLHAIEERYRSICAAMPDLLFRFDRDFHFVDALAADPARLALPPQSFIGKSVSEVFGAQRSRGGLACRAAKALERRAVAAISRARTSGQLQCFEYVFRRRSFEARVVPSGRDEALAIVRDITSAKAVARELRRGQARFAWLVEQSPTIVFTCAAKPPYPTVFISSNVLRYLGYRPDDFVSDPTLRTANVHPEDVAKVVARQRSLLNEGEHALEFRFRTATGSYRWIHEQARLAKAPGGRSLEIHGSWTDISDRRRLEDELGASEERLSLAVEAAGLGVWDWDIAADEAYLNAQYWKMIGYAEEETRPNLAFFLSRIHPDDVSTVELSMRQHFESVTQESVIEYRARTKSGEFRWFHGVGRVTARTDDGAPLRMAGVVLDITDVKARAEALRREEALRAAVRARDDLLAVVSHDLRGPLSTVLLSAEHLTKRSAGAERRASGKLLGALVRAAERMKRLIDDLLQAAAIEAGMFTIEPQRQAVPAIIDEALASLDALAVSTSVRLVRRVPRGIPPIFADAERVVQVLSNLVGNALKFGSAGGTVRVRAWARASEICFAVSDSGQGIPAEQLPHLFERHWQGPRSERHGIGLGLFIVKGIVERHGGRIWVKSRVGAGSTFYFTLPRDTS